MKKQDDPEQARQVGERMSQLRRVAGMTQREAGELVGVTERTIQSYEQGETIPYRLGMRFAEIYNTTIPYILYGEKALSMSGTDTNLLQMVLTELRALRSYVEVEMLEVRAGLEKGRTASRPVSKRV